MNATTTNEFLAKAKDIVNQHTELQQQVIMLQMQIGQLENTNMQAVSKQFLYHVYVDFLWLGGVLLSM